MKETSKNKDLRQTGDLSGEVEESLIDHRQLRHFLAVMEHGQFAKAAESLGLSKQALSQSIAALEHHVGARLFERGQFGAVPTDFGDVLRTHGMAIVAESRKAKAEIAGLKQEHRGEVTFALGAAFSELIGPLAIRQFQDSHPKVQLKIANVHPDNMVGMLERGELDFVAMGDIADGEFVEGLARQNLFSIKNNVVCAAGHPITKLKSVSMQDLAEYRWLTVWRTDRIRHFIEKQFVDAGVDSVPAFTFSDNFAVSRALVLDHDHLLIGNRAFFQREYDRDELVELPVPQFQRRISYALFYRKAVVRSRVVQGMMDAVRDAAKDLLGSLVDTEGAAA